MKQVLVTGASGFIGRQVLQPLLALGYEVHAVGRNLPAETPREVIWHPCDLLASDAARALLSAVRPTHLLHLAWIATPGVYWRSPINLDWVSASLTLYREFVDTGGTRALFIGTCAEYDWSHELLDEALTPCAPTTLYGTAKDALRRMLTAAALADRLSLAWGRVFYLYGPGEAESRLVPSVVLPLLRGEPALCGDGWAARDFMHVEDLGEAMAMSLDSDVTGPINLASGDCGKVRDIIERIGDLIGRPDLIRFNARHTAPDEPLRLAAATSLLRERVGFHPRFSLADGLSSTIAWWRHRLPSV